MPDDTPRRVMPRREATVQLPPPYEMFSVTVWVNIPPAVWRDMMSNDLDKCAAAFGQIVVHHDLVDYDGAPYAAGGSPDLYRQLPTDLVRVINDVRAAQIGRLSPPSALI